MLSLLNFATLVSNMAAAVQSSASALVDLTVGSVLRAILEANASVALWLQWLVLQVLAMTRLVTSTGTQVDSWVADFGLTRLPAVAASGPVTFSRYNVTPVGFVAVGTQVKTSDGTRIYQVIADSTNAAWNGSTGFNIASGLGSITCTVTDVTTSTNGTLTIGTAGNVSAGTITLLAGAAPGVDTVNNAAPFANGLDPETDAALRLRFSNYIQTLSKATLPAVNYAISSVQQGLDWTIQENINTAGVYTPGSFVVTVDNGTGAPPSSLLTAVSAQIALYRPIGSVWVVQAPSIVYVTISMTINNPAMVTAVANALQTYVDALADGMTLAYSRLSSVAYAVDPSITDVSAVLLNGATADIVPTAGQTIKTSTISVTG